MGTRVLALPSRQTGAVKTLAVDGAPAAFARAGDSVDVTLTDGADTVRWSMLRRCCPRPVVTLPHTRKGDNGRCMAMVSCHVA